MTENASERQTREDSSLTGSADVREGAQVITTTGVPANFDPPSAALIQPAAAEPPSSQGD